MYLPCSLACLSVWCAFLVCVRTCVSGCVCFCHLLTFMCVLIMTVVPRFCEISYYLEVKYLKWNHEWCNLSHKMHIDVSTKLIFQFFLLDTESSKGGSHGDRMLHLHFLKAQGWRTTDCVPKAKGLMKDGSLSIAIPWVAIKVSHMINYTTLLMLQSLCAYLLLKQWSYNECLSCSFLFNCDI